MLIKELLTIKQKINEEYGTAADYSRIIEAISFHINKENTISEEDMIDSDILREKIEDKLNIFMSDLKNDIISEILENKEKYLC